MKRIAYLLVSIIMIINLTGCTNNSNGEEVVNAFKVIWNDETSLSEVKVPFNIPKYVVNVKEYNIKTDFSNVENMDTVIGLSEKQKSSLIKNGFVVVPSTNTQMFNIYEQNEYEYIPNFVTSDVVLHMYHKLFDFSLKYTEKKYLVTELETLSNRMLKKSIVIYNDTKNMKDYANDNVAFFLVANMILNDGIVTVDAPKDILDKAKLEYELINKENIFKEKSPIFGFDIDYSQFKPRGHYTSDENLTKYFKTMMWYGYMRMPFINKGEDGKILERYWDDTLQAMLMTYTLFMDYEGKNDVDVFEKIYIPTKFLVGQSDDLTIYDCAYIIKQVYGENPNIEQFDNEEAKNKIIQLYEQLPDPKISKSMKLVDTPVTKQFRFMGQRYVLDGEILQKLIEPFKRPVPTGLDVAGVMGNERAEYLIFNELKPQEKWEEYESTYNKLKSKVSFLTEEEWKTTAYSGWLWALQSVFNTNRKGMPYFMNNKAWEHKSINTGLGSYAELKHDTVLYSKQACAEMGGPLALEEYDQHYVEPNVQLYAKLKWLSEYTYKNLEGQKLLDIEAKKVFSDYNDFLDLLIDCSIKELDNEILTEEQKESLGRIGGNMESLVWEIDNLANDSSSNISCSIVTDIATVVDGGVLQTGTGFPSDIYVIIPEGDKLYISRGSVYTYHEFLNDTGGRLTDEEWNKMLGITSIEEDGYKWYSYDEENVNKPDQPFWTKNYTPDNNSNIEIRNIDVDWDNMNE